eukprot:Opistho-2@20564
MDRAQVTRDVWALTDTLVSVPSASRDKAQNRSCLAIVADYFAGTRWHLTHFSKGPEASPMVYITSTLNGPSARFSKLLFLGHVDVVPHAEYRMQGSPEGIVTGRGVSDMKGPVACMMHMMKQMNPDEVDLAMLVVTDEEIGGIDCAKFAFADDDGPKISCDLCVCPDGGDNFKLVTHEKGVFRLGLTADGKAAHSAYPWNGTNAIQMVMDDIAALQRLTHDGKPLFDNEGPVTHWNSTVVPTIIQGGDVINQVPGKATAKVDIRFTEKWNLQSLRDVVLPAVTRCKCEVVFEQPMFHSPPEAQFMVDAKAVIEKVTGSPIQYSRGHGTSDVHWAPFPAVMFKPIGGGLHQDDEWLDFPSLITFYEILHELALHWATSKKRKASEQN